MKANLDLPFQEIIDGGILRALQETEEDNGQWTLDGV